MVIKKKAEVHGDGITKRTIHKTSYQPETIEEAEELVDELDEMMENIKQPWRGKQKWADDIREHATDLEAKAPKWEDSPKEHNEYFAKRKTKAWYFRAMALRIQMIENEIAAGKGWDAVSSAVQLGEFITEWRYKSDWEEAALFGDEQMGKLRRGGQSRLKHQPETVAGYVERLLDPKNPDGVEFVKEAVSLAAEHFGLGTSTVFEKLRIAKESAPDASDKSR